MSRELSGTALAASLAQETDEVYIILLTINHPDLTDDIRIASDPFELLPDAGVRGVVSRSKEYIYLPFKIVLPQEDDTGVSKASLEIDNISREIVAAVRGATSSLSIGIEIVMSSDVDTPEMSSADFKLERVKYDKYAVTGDITLEYYELEPFPAARFTPSSFPGIF